MNQLSENCDCEGSINFSSVNKTGAVFSLPDPQEILWRYQSFARFEQLLDERNLVQSLEENHA